MRKERVQPYVIRQLAAKIPLFVLGQRLETRCDGRKHGVDSIRGGLVVVIDAGKGVHVGLGIHVERLKTGLDVVEQIGIGRLRQPRRFVVRLERGLDFIRLVGEIKRHRAFLAGVRTVEPG